PLKHLPCLFQRIFVRAAIVHSLRTAHKRTLDIKTSVCLIWLGTIQRHSTSALIDREAFSPTQRRPITASVTDANRNSEFYAFLSQHPRPLSGCCPKLHRLFASVGHRLLHCAGSGAECPARDGTCRRHQGFASCQRSAEQH